MGRLVVYRNCFTGDVSGGDIHMSGLLSWMLSTGTKAQPVLVHSEGDGQERAYPEMDRISRVAHPDTSLKQSMAMMYLARAFRGVAAVNKLVGRGDVLVASSHFLPDVLPVFFARLHRRSKVVYIHHIIADMNRPKNLNNFLANMQEKLCLALVRIGFGKVIVVNQQVADRLRQLGFSGQQILLTSNFVDPLAAAKPFYQKDITLSFCGRMVEQKGVYDFLEVCRRIHSKHPNFRAVMVGAGPELARLKSIITRERLPIELTGYVDDLTKFDILSRSKLLVFPSVEEGWGIAIAEALAVGTPVLAYSLPVYFGVFGEQLYTVPVKDVDALVGQTGKLLRAYQDDPQHYAARQASITSYAEQFQVGRVASQEYQFMEAE